MNDYGTVGFGWSEYATLTEFALVGGLKRT
jgi:hypothetical protein